MTNFIDLKKYMTDIRTVCEREHWAKDWKDGGVYMHLEVSEFIESLRGKGDPIDELGDVLFTVFSVAEFHDLDPIEAINMSMTKHKIDKEPVIVDKKESVTIDKEQYDSLLENEKILDILLAAGVAEWEGFTSAMKEV